MTDNPSQSPIDQDQPAGSKGPSLLSRLLRRGGSSDRPRRRAMPASKRPGAWSIFPASLGEPLALIGTMVEIVVRMVMACVRLFGLGPRDEIESPTRYNVTRLRESAEATSPDADSPYRPVVHVIVNPISGVGRSLKALPLLRRGLKRRGFAVDVLLTRAAGEAIGYLEHQLARGVDDPERVARGHAHSHAVIAVGGDGTLGEVIRGVRASGQDVPIALFATGTANCLSSEFNLPKNPDEFCDLVANGRNLRMDIGELRCRQSPYPESPNVTHQFHSFIGAGFDARVLEEIAQRRTGNIWHSSYTQPVFESLRDYSFPPLSVRVDGSTLAKQGGLAVVSNIKSYAHMDVAPEASLVDGRLDVTVVRRRSVLGHIRTIWRAARRDPGYKSEVLTRQGTVVEIDCPTQRVPVQADGDHVGYLPARVEILVGAIRLIVPSGPLPEELAAQVSSAGLATPARTAKITALPQPAPGEAASGRRAARTAAPGLDTQIS